nr:DUF2500 domain-containing protein [uncultured Blautia sp.]
MEIMLVLIIAIFTAILFRCIFEWTINKCSAMESVDALVVAKQQGMIQQQIPNTGDATGGHGFTLQEQPWYKITFRMTDSTEKEFNVDNQSFRELKEGEKGILTYQGTRYLGFKKDS